MPIDDPNVLLNDPDMSRDFLSDMLGTAEKKEKPPPDGKYLEGQPVVVDGLKGRPELNGRRGRALAGTGTRRSGGSASSSRRAATRAACASRSSTRTQERAADAKARCPAVWEEEVAPAAELRTPLAQFEELRAALVELDPSAAIDDAAAAAAEPSSTASFAARGRRRRASRRCRAIRTRRRPRRRWCMRCGRRAATPSTRSCASRRSTLWPICARARRRQARALRAAAAPAIVGGCARRRRRRCGAHRARQLCQRRRGVQGGGARGRRHRGGGDGDARFPKEALLQQMGVGLANMANAGGRCQKAVFDANGPAAVVRAMGAFRGDDRLQYFGCLALANLASERDAAAKEAVCDAGAAAVVAAALDRQRSAAGSAAAAGVRGGPRCATWRAARPSASRQSPTRAGSARSRG